MTMWRMRRVTLVEWNPISESRDYSIIAEDRDTGDTKEVTLQTVGANQFDTAAVLAAFCADGLTPNDIGTCT